jgi:hypothetical protein
MTTLAQSEVARLKIDINVTLGDIAAFQERLSNPSLTNLQRTVATSNLAKAEARLISERTALAAAEAKVAAQDQVPVVPTPPKTAGETVSDDAVPNPIKQQPVETDPNTGRIQNFVPETVPSNADQIPTTTTGDTDVNTNGAPKTFSVTQSSSDEQEQTSEGAVLAPREPEFPPGTQRPNNQGNVTDPSQAGTVPAGTPVVTTGQAAVDDNPFETSQSVSAVTNNTANDPITIKPQDNVLDLFASYTYGISVYLMTPEAYKTFVTSKKRTLNGSNLLFQSGGAPGNSGIQFPGDPTDQAPEGASRNPYFDVDFYIDSLTLDTAFPGKQTGAAHMASDLKFTVIEPNGITLLDRMYAAVQDHVPKDGAGKVNYTAVQYLLAIRWYGWDLGGNLIRGVGQTQGLTDPNAAIEKFIPFKIRKVNWAVSNKLVTYDFVCAPVGQQIAGGQSRGTIPYDIELTDSTVGGLLGGDAQYGTASPNATPPTAPEAPQKANAAPSNKPTIRQGLMGAMNDFQKKLVKDGKYEYADTYEIVFANGAESIKDSSIIKPANIIKNLAATPMGKPVTSDPNGLDPRKNQVDNTLRNSAVTAGQQLLQVIDLTIRNSTFITQQAVTQLQEEPDLSEFNNAGQPGGNGQQQPSTAKINWYNITMEAVPRISEYDYKRNDYAYDIRYIISPYVVVNFDSKYFPIPKFNGLHKSYNYWFTGKNSAVLDYQATFNSLYNMTISGDDKNSSATEAIRRKYTSSMRDIPTYVYQARSSESNFGADGKGNETSANAAEYLYSPSDLATAKVRIVGDPGWIQQGSVAAGVDPKNFDYKGFLPDGTINFDSQQVMFEIAWQRPEDYNINTGLADPYSGAYSGNENLERQAIQSYVYQARKCVSEFRQGRFEQTIEGSLYNFPVPQQQNTATAQTASVSVDAGGIAERGGVVPTTADFKLPDRGGLLLAPSAIDTVQLSASGIASSAVAAVNLIRQEARPAISNGVELERVTIPAPPVFGAEATAITNTPSQQMSGEA